MFPGVKMAAKLKSETKGATMDYRKARKIFGSHRSWRREYAAGWLAAGKKISHVTAAERREIAKARKRHLKPRDLRAGSFRLTPDGGSNCRGRSGYVRLDERRSDYFNRYYFDSCQTNVIIRNFGSCMGVAGLLAGLIPNPGTAATAALVIFGCGAASSWVQTAQANSSVSAIIVETGRYVKYTPRTGGASRYQTPVKVRPQ